MPWVRRSASVEESPQPVSWTFAFTDRPASSDPTLRFTVQVEVTWRHICDATTADPHAAARLVREVVDDAAITCDVLRPDAANHDVTAALQAALPIRQNGIEVLESRIQLLVDESTKEAALLAERIRQGCAREETRQRQEHEREETQLRLQRAREESQRRHEYAREEDRLRREYELDALARRQVRARAEFLNSEILANPASARLYTLLERSAEHWPRLGGLPAATDLTNLVREVQQWQPHARWVVVAQLLHDFVVGLSEDGRTEFLTILARAVHVYGDEERAQELFKAAEEQV